MPLINYKETMSFPDAVEAAVILLALCLVNLRDEAAHREDEDPATLTAAHFFIDLLEDTLKESEALANTLELSFIDYPQRRNKTHLFFTSLRTNVKQSSWSLRIRLSRNIVFQKQRSAGLLRCRSQ